MFFTILKKNTIFFLFFGVTFLFAMFLFLTNTHNIIMISSNFFFYLLAKIKKKVEFKMHTFNTIIISTKLVI